MLVGRGSEASVQKRKPVNAYEYHKPYKPLKIIDNHLLRTMNAFIIIEVKLVNSN